MKERTLVFIKPDGVKRNLIGEIIRRYEQGGLKVIALKMEKPSMKKLKMHYPDNENYLISIAKKAESCGESIDNYIEYGRNIVNALRSYIASGPIVLMILEGENAVIKVREITGFTDPSKAKKGTIRGDFGDDSIIKANSEGRACRNLVHASGSIDEAKKEIEIWFGKKFNSIS